MRHTVETRQRGAISSVTLLFALRFIYVSQCLSGYVCRPCGWLKRSEEDMRVPGTRVTDALSHRVDSESWTRDLKEEQVLFNHCAISPRDPSSLFFYFSFFSGAED